MLPNSLKYAKPERIKLSSTVNVINVFIAHVGMEQVGKKLGTYQVHSFEESRTDTYNDILIVLSGKLSEI